MMTVLWRYLGEDGGEVGASEPFADQELAEAWLAGSWRDLYERGIEKVALVGERGEVVYQMGLHEGAGG